jgi:hypothetical protein
MSKVIALKIDVTKIDKQRLYKGEKGTYLDAVLFLEDEDDRFGQRGMITQSVKKEEREAGTRGAILGNCKVLSEKPAQGVTTAQVKEVLGGVPESDSDDLPFAASFY